MQSTSSERDPVEVLADEFVQRRRRGETPSLTEYVQRFPKLADEIRAVFPAIVALEKFGPAAAEASAGLTPQRAEITRSMAESIGDYRILREVGRGAMGVVYEAEQQSLDRRVALKVLPWHSVANAKAVERFRREARAAARLHHTNIVPVFDVGQSGEVCYFAMQFIQGQSLDNVMVELRHLQAGVLPGAAGEPLVEDQRPAASSLALSMYTEAFAQARLGEEHTSGAINRRGGAAAVAVASDSPAPETVTLKHPSTVPGTLLNDPKARSQAYRSYYYRSVAHVAERVADALAYAHERGIVHRDIKPSNLMLDAAGVVWVTDFGLAKTNDESLTRTGDLLGTLRYMAPERFEGKCDAQADVYSLGATLYELLCLRPARDASEGADLIAQITRGDPVPPRKIDPNIPLDLERIVLKSLERDPRHRYGSAQALADDLRRFLNDQPILGRRVSPVERFGRWAKRNRALATTMVGGIALLLAAVIVSSFASASFSALAKREKKARVETTSNLYHSLLRQAEATRLARREGYRAQAWSLLEQARNLDTPEVDINALRREAILSLGDFLGQKPITLTDFPTDVTAAVASPDGTVVVVGLRNGVLRWYGADSGELLEENKQHSAAVDRLRFNRSGDLLLSTDAVGAVRSWKKRDNHWQVSVLPSLGQQALAVEPVHDGQFMVAYKPLPEYAEIVVQDLAQNRKVSIFPPAPIAAVALNRNGSMLAGVGQEDLYVWETRGGSVLERTTTNLGPLQSVTFSQDGKLLFCGSKQGLVVFDLPELRQQTFMRYDEVPLGAFGPEGKHVAFASVNRRITLWNIPANRELAVLSHPGWKDLHSLSFAEDGRILVSADGEFVRIWQVRGGPEKSTLSGHSGSVNGVSFGPGANRLVSVGLDRNVMAWDTKTGLRTAINSVPVAATAVMHGQSGEALLVGDASGVLHLMDAETLKVKQTVDSSLGAIHAIRRSPADDRMAVAGERGAGIWRLKGTAKGPGEKKLTETAWLEKERMLPGADCPAVAFSPDGQFVAWIDRQRNIRLIETDSGIEWPLSCPPLLRGWQNLAFEPGGEHLLAVNQQGQVVGWTVVADRRDFALGEPSTFQGTHLAVSSRSAWLAADALPMQISIWDLSSRQPFFVFREEPSAVNVTTWDAKGRLLAVGSKDGSLAIWNLPALQKELAGIDLDWPSRGEGPAAANKPATPLKRLQRAVESEPKDLRLRFRRATILAAHGDDKQSLADLNEILTAQPDHRSALIARANVRAKAGEWHAAAADFQAAIHLDQPSTTAEWRTVALLLACAGDAEEYRKHGEALLERLPDDAPPDQVERTLLSCVLMKSAIPPRELPVAQLKRHLELGGGRLENRSRAWLTLALAAHRTGDSWEAIQLVRQAQDEESYSHDPALPALSFAILSLAQQNEAQESLARTSLEAARDFKSRVPPPADATRFATEGHDRLTIDLLEKEAAFLLER